MSDIKKAVQGAGGVMTFQAWELRDAIAAGRLTPRINGMISETLKSYGLGHVPADPDLLPTSQYEFVRVYDLGTSVGKVIAAAQAPGEANDRLLIESVDGDAADLVARVRAIVAE
ncbi:hypothetical protein W823_21705 [Williamsia sp. D3]|nr:hypothetical protein W823_21705 [Williamsia sp. D3]